MTPIQAMITTREASEILKVHPATVTRWAQAGKIPCVVLPSGYLRFREEDLVTLLTSQIRQPPAKATTPEPAEGITQVAS